MTSNSMKIALISFFLSFAVVFDFAHLDDPSGALSWTAFRGIIPEAVGGTFSWLAMGKKAGAAYLEIQQATARLIVSFSQFPDHSTLFFAHLFSKRIRCKS